MKEVANRERRCGTYKQYVSLEHHRGSKFIFENMIVGRTAEYRVCNSAQRTMTIFHAWASDTLMKINVYNTY